MTKIEQQWSFNGGAYMPVGGTVDALPPGCYTANRTMAGILFYPIEPITDEIIDLPSPEAQQVVTSIHQFWGARAQYDRFGLLYKRGILMYGPPGSGKTILMRRICNELIAANGSVLFCYGDVGDTAKGLATLRNIEPKRPLAVVYEDIDHIAEYQEEPLLDLLDGGTQIENVIHLATTNYISKLDGRISNRPSRFDEVIEIGMPTEDVRAAYIAHFVDKYHVDGIDVDHWAKSTAGMAVAHIRELFVAVVCLGQPFTQALNRLQKLAGLEAQQQEA